MASNLTLTPRHRSIIIISSLEYLSIIGIWFQTMCRFRKIHSPPPDLQDLSFLTILKTRFGSSIPSVID
jgi:hypothetical protein